MRKFIENLKNIFWPQPKYIPDVGNMRVDDVIKGLNIEMSMDKASALSAQKENISKPLMSGVSYLSSALFLYPEASNETRKKFKEAISLSVNLICDCIEEEPSAIEKIKKMPFEANTNNKFVISTIENLFKDNINLLTPEQQKRLSKALKFNL